MYRVETILKRKKVKGNKMVLVKWFGYESKQNTRELEEAGYQSVTSKA